MQFVNFPFIWSFESCLGPISAIFISLHLATLIRVKRKKRCIEERKTDEFQSQST